MPVQRIAMLSVHTCPLAAPGGYKTGGMNVYVAELSRELARRGIKIDIFTRDQASCAPHRGLSFDPSQRELPVRVIHIPAGPLETIEPEALVPYLATFASEVKDFAARESIRYDAIYSHYWLSGLVAQDLKLAWHVPVMQMFHTLGIMKDRIARMPADSPRDYAEATIMVQADRLIAATQAERLQMLYLYGAPDQSISIIPPGVDTAQFTPGNRVESRAKLGWSVEQKALLFVGRIEPLKALDTILQSVALAFEQAPDLRQSARLYVIGGTQADPEVIEMRALAEQLEIADCVTFLGAQSHDRLPDFYRAADLLLMPSDYESFGMSALESMACGTPVLATQVGGLAYVINDQVNGLHVPPRDVPALAHAITQLVTDAGLRVQLGQNAAQGAKSYAWSRIADQVLAVLDSI